MADFQPIGQPVPSNSVPIAGKDDTGKLAYLTLDASGNLNVNVGGALGSAVTIADGADVTEGAIADAKVVGDNSGTVSAKLRGLNYLINLVVDTVNSWLKVHIADGHDVNAGTTTDALVIGNFDGTLSAKVRGLSYGFNQIINAGSGWMRVSSGPPAINYDYTSLAPAATQDVWTFKTGGSGGATVQTVTINYTDATKTVITNVAWT